LFLITKFSQVWSILIFLPIIVVLFHRIRRHYEAVGDQLSLKTCEPPFTIEGNVMIVPVAGMTHVVENTLNYVKSLSPDQIIAVYVAFEREDEKMFEEKWNKWQPDVRLVTLHSHYRSIISPHFLRLICCCGILIFLYYRGSLVLEAEMKRILYVDMKKIMNNKMKAPGNPISSFSRKARCFYVVLVFVHLCNCF